jgi:hypothetical protein
MDETVAAWECPGSGWLRHLARGIACCGLCHVPACSRRAGCGLGCLTNRFLRYLIQDPRS